MAIPPNSPAVNAGNMYVQGLQLSIGNVITNLAVSLGQARDSTNINDIVLDASNPNLLNGVLEINGLIVGANGMDVAPIVNNTQYAVYIIGSSKSPSVSSSNIGGPANAPNPFNPYPVAGLISLASNAQPYLPNGYDMYRRIGWVNSFTVTADILAFFPFYQYGYGSERDYYLLDNLGVFSGNASSLTPVSLNVASNGIPIVPPIADEVYLNVKYTSTAAANVATFRPFGSPLAVETFSVGAATTPNAAQTNVDVYSLLHNGVPTISVQTGAGDNLQIFVIGYHDYI